VQLVNQESSRVARTARRIVLMFQFYKQNIDLNDEAFLTFVSEYLKRKNVNVEKVPYHELYVHVRRAIQEYLRAGENTLRNDA